MMYVVHTYHNSSLWHFRTLALWNKWKPPVAKYFSIVSWHQVHESRQQETTGAMERNKMPWETASMAQRLCPHSRKTISAVPMPFHCVLSKITFPDYRKNTECRDHRFAIIPPQACACHEEQLWRLRDGACTAERTFPLCPSNTTVGCPLSHFQTTQKSLSAVIKDVQLWEKAAL